MEPLTVVYLKEDSLCMTADDEIIIEDILVDDMPLSESWETPVVKCRLSSGRVESACRMPGRESGEVRSAELLVTPLEYECESAQDRVKEICQPPMEESLTSVDNLFEVNNLGNGDPLDETIHATSCINQVQSALEKLFESPSKTSLLDSRNSGESLILKSIFYENNEGGKDNAKEIENPKDLLLCPSEVDGSLVGTHQTFHNSMEDLTCPSKVGPLRNRIENQAVSRSSGAINLDVMPSLTDSELCPGSTVVTDQALRSSSTVHTFIEHDDIISPKALSHPVENLSFEDENANLQLVESISPVDDSNVNVRDSNTSRKELCLELTQSIYPELSLLDFTELDNGPADQTPTCSNSSDRSFNLMTPEHSFTGSFDFALPPDSSKAFGGETIAKVPSLKVLPSVDVISTGEINEFSEAIPQKPCSESLAFDSHKSLSNYAVMGDVSTTMPVESQLPLDSGVQARGEVTSPKI